MVDSEARLSFGNECSHALMSIRHRIASRPSPRVHFPAVPDSKGLRTSAPTSAQRSNLRLIWLRCQHKRTAEASESFHPNTLAFCAVSEVETEVKDSLSTLHSLQRVSESDMALQLRKLASAAVGKFRAVMLSFDTRTARFFKDCQALFHTLVSQELDEACTRAKRRHVKHQSDRECAF